MKSEAECYFCKKKVLNRNEYIIFTLPRLYLKYKVGHKKCYNKYITTHPQPSMNKGYSFIPILNSSYGWFYVGLLLFALAVFSFILFIRRNDSFFLIYASILGMGILFTLAALVYYLSNRIYFWLKFE